MAADEYRDANEREPRMVRRFFGEDFGIRARMLCVQVYYLKEEQVGAGHGTRRG